MLGPSQKTGEPLSDYVRRILDARVYDVAIQTPLDPMVRLSQRLGASVLLKREDLQPVFSFKIRGAYNRIAKLSDVAKAAGVICASAGNHAQGVALSAKRMGIKAVIVMPVTTPAIKVEAVRYWGGEVVLHGDTFDEAHIHARAIESERGMTFVHPYDDGDVIAGQGTIGVEILHQHPDPIEAVFVPIGGGGLAAGIASYVKFLRPETKVIGVEPVDAASMKAAITAGERVILDRVGLFADGVAVRQAGEETFRVCRELLDDIILANTDAMCAAIKDIFEDVRVLTEPAGALSLAGLKAYAEANPKRTGALIAISSGANMNFDRLRYVGERADLGAKREALFAVEIPEQRGSFLAFCERLGRRSVTEFNYRYSDSSRAHIFVGLAVAGAAAEREALASEIGGAGFRIIDLSNNEMAKLHLRYMVGGPAPQVAHERLYRFEFPERPGALLKFLRAVGVGWNITLFHYRNHGSDYGRVLAGIDVPPETETEFLRHLELLNYRYVEETGNDVARLFLTAG